MGEVHYDHEGFQIKHFSALLLYIENTFVLFPLILLNEYFLFLFQKYV